MRGRIEKHANKWNLTVKVNVTNSKPTGFCIEVELTEETNLELETNAKKVITNRFERENENRNRIGKWLFIEIPKSF